MSKPAKAKAEEATEEKGGKKSPKKLIIIALIVVAALSAGGAGAWFFLGSKGDAKEAHHQPAQLPPPVFVKLEPFTVNLQSEDEEHYLQASIELQVKDEEASEKIKLYMPQVRSRLLMLLSSKKASEINTAEGKHKLSDEIIAQVKQPFAKGAAEQEISGVFFTDLVIQ